MDELVRKILRARVYDVIQESPIDAAPRLSSMLQERVLIKREDAHAVFSFKIRGAYNKMAHLSAVERAKGVIAASAGNHAQGVALASERMGVDAVIVMPTTTPSIKVEAVRARGVRVVLHGDAYDDAAAHAMKLQRDEGRTFIHPYDDRDVIAGQGTIALELARQVSGEIDAVFVPVGGGGLIAGIVAYLSYVRPETRVIGVEPEDAASLKAALEAGAPVTLPRVGLFADGVAVQRVGQEPYSVLHQHMRFDDVVTVSTDEICAAVRDVFEDTRAVSEPAGALSIAGMKKWSRENPSSSARTLVPILTGANVNFDRLRYVAERAQIGERREAILGVTIPEEPGSFLAFCRQLAGQRITEFNYRYASGGGPAHIFVGVELSGADGERARLVQMLRDGGYETTDLTESQMAGLHVRFMVGGRARGIAHERLIRFVFPERPGAFQTFLERLGDTFNISLFHYRNHGAAWGNVLAGIEVAPEHADGFEALLTNLHYDHVDETEHPAYRMFLK